MTVWPSTFGSPSSSSSGSVATLSEADRPLAADEVTQALDAAIVEAREALVTMRSSLEERRALRRHAGAHDGRLRGCRSGLRAGVLDGHAASRQALAPRVQVELLRIVTEALNNVRKHADATTVRVVSE